MADDVDATQWPSVIVVVGFVVTFLTFFVRHWIPLVLGLLLMVVGAGWAIARSRGSGTGPGHPRV